MTSVVNIPQARIPIGWAMVDGQRLPVEIDIQWMRAFLSIVDRTGGTSVANDLNDYVALLANPSPQDTNSQEALRAVDELRNEATSRAEWQALRSRVEQIEDRLS